MAYNYYFLLITFIYIFMTEYFPRKLTAYSLQVFAFSDRYSWLRMFVDHQHSLCLQLNFNPVSLQSAIWVRTCMQFIANGKLVSCKPFCSKSAAWLLFLLELEEFLIFRLGKNLPNFLVYLFIIFTVIKTNIMCRDYMNF